MSTPVIVIIAIIAYFALLLSVSLIASRGSDNDTFFTGNRRAPWPVVSFAMIGAMISGVTFISVPGMVVNSGYAYLQMVLGFIVGYFIIAYLLVPMFYRSNLASIYGYLGERFGKSTYLTGAWLFFISKMLGASVRFLVVCIVLQLLVCQPLHIPFAINVIATIALIGLYTVKGGVKSVIWTDTLKSFCLIMSVVLCIYYVAKNLGLSFSEMTDAVKEHQTSRIFFFDDPKSGLFFWKQFLAGIFMSIATNGLDQDMMQRNLACRDHHQSQKNMIVSGIMQFFVIGLFLMLGTLLVIFLEYNHIPIPTKTDEIFGMVVWHNSMPIIVGVLFVIGLISAAYSAAGSALTSLTTSFTVDILNGQERYSDSRLSSVRKWVHVAMSVIMGVIIIGFYYLIEQDAISAVYTVASYTYGPILGLFVYGIFWHKPINDRWVPAVCIFAPVLSWAIQYGLNLYFGYKTSFELLIINAILTVIGLRLLSIGQRSTNISTNDAIRHSNPIKK